MKSDWPQSEVDVGRALIPLLEKARWEVWDEVNNIDLVCRRAREDGDGFDVMTVELTKGGPSFDKLGQAMAHKGKAQFVAWAMPLKRESRSRETASACSLAMGVSLIEVSPSECRTTWADRDKNANAAPLLEELDKRPKRYAPAPAGRSGGSQWSKANETWDAAAAWISANPGHPLRDVVKEIDHHFSSDQLAVKRLRQEIRKGRLKKRVKLDPPAGLSLAYPREAA